MGSTASPISLNTPTMIQTISPTILGKKVNDLVLLVATTYYDFLGCQRTKEMEALTTWFMTLHPDVLSQDVNPAVQALVLASGEIRSLPREQQLKNWLNVDSDPPGPGLKAMRGA